VTSRYPDKFMALAKLPISSPGAAIEETKRASRDLGMKGVLIS